MTEVLRYEVGSGTLLVKPEPTWIRVGSLPTARL